MGMLFISFLSVGLIFCTCICIRYSLFIAMFFVEKLRKNGNGYPPAGEESYQILKDFLGDGIFNVDGDPWRYQRKLASYEFSRRAVMDFSSSVFRSKAAELALHLSVVASTHMAIDMQDLLMRSTLETMFIIGFGMEPSGLIGSTEKWHAFADAFNDANAFVTKRYADVMWKLKRFLNIGSEAALKKHVKLIDDLVFKLILHKREHHGSPLDSEGKKDDILSRFLTACEKDPEHITDRFLRDIILSFMLAGRDTTSVTLSWFLYMICKHPSVERKILKEINDAVSIEDGSIENFSESLNNAALNRMHYLHAALAETLRLYPAVPLDGKECTEDDTLPDGFKVRKGDLVTYPIYAMGRMTYLWGNNADLFQPERWIEDGIFRPESPFKFTAFQAGPRICLGKEFAYQQMKIIAATLLYFYKFKLEDEQQEVRYRTMLTLHIDQGLSLHVFPRK
ncbi:Cytochrome P450 704C1 [Nymphaea thermarum]|nr:Cytochrome P450 704C1 [Nymphaea thermarum]